jgi:LPS export ABC transporter protein LptC
VETRISLLSNLIFSGCLIWIILLFALPSCENDVQQVNKISTADTIPVEIVKDFEVIESENSKLSFILTSPLLLRYEGKDPFIEFPEGLSIVFYDTSRTVKSELTANWGVSYEKRKIIEAKNDVVVINHEKNERLNTEHLIWDQNKRLIYSEVFVKITTEDKTIYGENGLEADEQFDSWRLKKVKGDILLDQDEY